MLKYIFVVVFGRSSKFCGLLIYQRRVDRAVGSGGFVLRLLLFLSLLFGWCCLCWRCNMELSSSREAASCAATHKTLKHFIKALNSVV
jgi:hypothetical protein